MSDWEKIENPVPAGSRGKRPYRRKSPPGTALSGKRSGKERGEGGQRLDGSLLAGGSGKGYALRCPYEKAAQKAERCGDPPPQQAGPPLETDLVKNQAPLPEEAAPSFRQASRYGMTGKRRQRRYAAPLGFWCWRWP